MHFYGDEVKQSLLAQLNERLEIEISVEEIQLDLFTNFPRGSLRLREINSREKTSSAGKSLLKAGEVALLFNLADIIRGDYKIERINLEDAFLNLAVQEDGKVNYQIFRKDPGTDSEMSVNLKKVHFKNVVISYIHLPSQQEYLFRIDGGNLEGTFSSRLQQFHFDGNIHSTHIKSGRNVFLVDRALSLDTEMAIDKDQNTIRFLNGDIESEGLNFNLTGNVVTREINKNLSLDIIVERSSVHSLFKLIPPEYLEPVNDIELDGEVAMTVNIDGNFSGNHIPGINVQFTVEEGSFLHKKSGLTLSELMFDGIFTNGESRSEKSYALSISNIHSTIKGGQIEGSLEISDFLQPKIHTRLKSHARIEDLTGIFNIDTVESISGMMELNLEFRKQFNNFRKFTIEDFISSQTSGSMKIKDMNFRLKKSPHNFRDFNGTFRFNNKDLKIDEFTGTISGSDFKMEGYFRNVLAYAFIPDEPIFINADFHSDHFDLDRILETGKGQGSEKTRLSFSEKVNYNLNIQIDTFTFRKFSSTRNIGQLVQRDQTLYVKNTRINSMDGQVVLNGTINGENSELYTILCQAEFTDVNIQKLFRDFGDFGQQNITSEHLRGTVNANVEYSSTLTPYLFVDQRSVYTLADVEIHDGELIRYQPLKKLSKYVREGELEHVKFSTLKNNIRIQDEVVYIPRMDIESSSMNLSLYGQHTFSNEIDYHVQMMLSEIISRKEAIEEDLGDNFIADDGLGRTKLFLSMTGSAEDPVVKYDSREVRNKIASDLKEEKGELKKIFREEFGLDSKNKDPQNDPPTDNSGKQQNFTIEWDETKDKQADDKVLKKQENTGKKKKDSTVKEFIIEWEETRDTIDKEESRNKNRSTPL